MSYATEKEIRTASLLARRTIAQRRFIASCAPEGSLEEMNEATALRASVESDLCDLLGVLAAFDLIAATDAENGVNREGYAPRPVAPVRGWASIQGTASNTSHLFTAGAALCGRTGSPRGNLAQRGGLVGVCKQCRRAARR